ncbi:MAG: MerR family transcriptional regulator [Litorimonas sp.]
MRAKTTRAFRTISEAGEELGLQPHVLRFWESKFTEITPIKRGGNRRFYRPEDIELLRGIKTLLYVEKHPIKDVQKLIAKSGAARVRDLGRSVEQAARERDITETTLVPERIETPDTAAPETVARSQPAASEPKSKPEPEAVTVSKSVPPAPEKSPAPAPMDVSGLEDALARLQGLRRQWEDFGKAG